MERDSQEIRGRVNLLAQDGSPIAAEFIAVARLDEAGRFAGANGSVRDMRDRDRLERELHDSEARFRQLVQTSPDVIYRADAEGRFVFMAEGSEALFGWAPADVIGMNFADFTAEESLAEAMANFQQQMSEHDVVRRFRYMVKYRDGTTFPAEITSVSVWEDGRFAGVQGTVRDVTMAERLERELRESQERYRFLVENSPDVVFSTDAEGLFTFMSESMERMTGWKPDEVIGEHFSKTVEDASLPETAARWAALMEDPATEQIAHINLQGPDGRLVPVEVSAVAMVDDEGRFAGIHGSTRDISERARLERELRESEERYRYLVASSPDLVWLTDAEGTLTFVSDAARTMLGSEPTELMGRPYADDLRTVGAPRRGGPLPLAGPPSERRPPDAAAVPPFRWARGPGRDQRDRDDRRRGSSSGRTGRRATSASATGWNATCAARPASWRPARNGPTSPASSTIR